MILKILSSLGIICFVLMLISGVTVYGEIDNKLKIERTTSQVLGDYAAVGVLSCLGLVGLGLIWKK
jgi:hypothetical protein